MGQDELPPTLGRCPLCEQRVPSRHLLAKYTEVGSWPRMLAECPTCEEVVPPI